jgi:hypothetical protein
MAMASRMMWWQARVGAGKLDAVRGAWEAHALEGYSLSDLAEGTEA